MRENLEVCACVGRIAVAPRREYFSGLDCKPLAKEQRAQTLEQATATHRSVHSTRSKGAFGAIADSTTPDANATLEAGIFP